jgi:two-component system NarL family response regulator
VKNKTRSGDSVANVSLRIVPSLKAWPGSTEAETQPPAFTFSSSLPERAKKISVLIADDHPVVRQGLAAILSSQDDIEIVAEATDGEEACELYDQHSPDVLMLDLRMPKKDGLQIVTELMSQRVYKPRILVMTFYDSEENIRQTLSAGAKGFLLKCSHPQQIREAVRRVAQGESFLPPEIGLKLAESVARSELSKRETQVLHCLALGRSNKEIGRALYICEGTVKHHVKSILSKLNANGRGEAIAIAAKRGLVHLG